MLYRTLLKLKERNGLTDDLKSEDRCVRNLEQCRF